MARGRGCKFSKSQTKTEREEKGDTVWRGEEGVARHSAHCLSKDRSHQMSFTFFLGTAGHRDELGFKEGSVVFTLRDIL